MQTDCIYMAIENDRVGAQAISAYMHIFALKSTVYAMDFVQLVLYEIENDFMLSAYQFIMACELAWDKTH